MAEKLANIGSDVLVLCGIDEWLRWQKWAADADKPPLPPATLAIPHLCQYGPGADKRRNDCGAACVAMVARGLTDKTPTVDEVAIEYQQAPNRYMSFGDLLMALRVGYGLLTEYIRPLRADAIRDALAAGRAVIALVKYPKMPTQALAFNGSHFIVVYGFEGDSFLYRDPLAKNDAPLRIAAARLEAAMRGFDEGENRPFQGLVVGVNT